MQNVCYGLYNEMTDVTNTNIDDILKFTGLDKSTSQ